MVGKQTTEKTETPRDIIISAYQHAGINRTDAEILADTFMAGRK